MVSSATVRSRSVLSSNMANIALNVALLLSAFAFFVVMRYPVFKPILYAPQYSFDLGNARPESELRKSFTIQNLHPWSVTVTGIEGSCGCAKPFLNRATPFVLHPLEIVATSVQIEAPKEKGEFSQTVTVLTAQRKSDTSFRITTTITD